MLIGLKTLKPEDPSAVLYVKLAKPHALSVPLISLENINIQEGLTVTQIWDEYKNDLSIELFFED